MSISIVYGIVIQHYQLMSGLACLVLQDTCTIPWTSLAWHHSTISTFNQGGTSYYKTLGCWSLSASIQPSHHGWHSWPATTDKPCHPTPKQLIVPSSHCSIQNNKPQWHCPYTYQYQLPKHTSQKPIQWHPTQYFTMATPTKSRTTSLEVMERSPFIPLPGTQYKQSPKTIGIMAPQPWHWLSLAMENLLMHPDTIPTQGSSLVCISTTSLQIGCLDHI